MKKHQNSKGFKGTLNRLKKVNKEIKIKEVEYSETSKSIYYNFISTESQRKIDLLEISIEIKELTSLKYSILESLQIEINLMCADISEMQRELTLTINK